MKRKECLIKHVINIIRNCDSKNFYKLLFELQNTNIFYGYSTAILFEFDNKALKGKSDKEITEVLKNGEYDRLFDEWLREEL